MVTPAAATAATASFMIMIKLSDNQPYPHRQGQANTNRACILCEEVSHNDSSFSALRFYFHRRGFQRFAFFIRPKEHIQGEGNNREGNDAAQYIAGTREQHAQLIYYKRGSIREHALITDSEPGPFRAVHFTFDSTDGRKARSAQQVEY